MWKSYIVLILIFKIRIFSRYFKRDYKRLQIIFSLHPSKVNSSFAELCVYRPRFSLYSEQRENSIHGMYASQRRVCEYALYTYATTVHKIFICVYLVVLAILFHTSLAPGTKGWLPRSCIAVQQRVYTWRAHLSPFHPSVAVRSAVSEAVCQISGRPETFAFCSVPNATLASWMSAM